MKEEIVKEELPPIIKNLITNIVNPDVPSWSRQSYKIRLESIRNDIDVALAIYAKELVTKETKPVKKVKDGQKKIR